MRHGLGVIRWPPETFWKATLTELYRAVEGWQECHGLGRYGKTPQGQNWLTEKEVDNLHELEEMFPDE